MTSRDILDQIDDVIHWDGHSPDAMTWTAEPPKLPALDLSIDAEAARQAFARLGEQLQSLVEAFRPAAEQVMRSAVMIYEAFDEIARMPGMRELSEAQQHRRRAMKSEYARRRRGRRR